MRGSRHALDRAGVTSTVDRCALVAVLAWLGWVAASPIWSGQQPALLSPYVMAPVLLVLGASTGRALARRRNAWPVPVIAAVLALVVLLAVPFYRNAQAALGIQLVALAGLTLLIGPAGAGTRGRAAIRYGAAAALAVLGVLLAMRSQAATVLVLPVVVAVAAAVVRRRGPPRGLVGGAGLGVVVAAAAVVVWLGSRSAWPTVLTGGGSLSSARHVLWGDALVLWAQHPFVGGGPGSFVEHSALAGSTPHLDTVHSSALQVAAELGLVGLVLLLCLFAAGLAVAAQGPRTCALLAVAAWTALGVHSMIDHLYEFPAVTVLAGLVLGWGGRPAADDEAVPPARLGPRRRPRVPRSGSVVQER